jgi:putative peptide zinc metalloprotease protein
MNPDLAALQSEAQPEARPEAPHPARADALPDTLGSVCPRLRGDVTSWPFFHDRDLEKRIYIIGSREVDRYISVPAAKLPVVMKVLEMLDGQHSLESIESYFYEKQRKKVDVTTLYRRLYENGLIAMPAPAAIKKGDIERMSFQLCTLSVERGFLAISKLNRLIFPWGVIAMLLVIVAGTALALTHLRMLAAPIRSAVHGSLGAPALLYPVLMLLSFLLHEMAHGIAGTHYGIVARRFEAALYLGFIPIIYLRIPGIYTLKPAERIKVWCAGVFWNLTLASICVGLMVWSASPVWHETWLMIAMANYFIAVTNLFPFLPTDGYFILSTLFKTHNIRSNAWREFGNWIRARKHSFSGILLLYFVCTATIVGVVLWKDIAWLHQLGNGGTRQQYLLLAFFMGPWVLVLGWRLMTRRWRSAGNSGEELPAPAAAAAAAAKRRVRRT